MNESNNHHRETAGSFQRNVRSELLINERTHLPHFVTKGHQTDIGSNTASTYSVDGKWDAGALSINSVFQKQRKIVKGREFLQLSDETGVENREDGRDISDDESDEEMMTNIISNSNSFSISTSWDEQLPKVFSNSAHHTKEKLGRLIGGSLNESGQISRAVSPSEYIPSDKILKNKIDMAKKSTFGEITSHVYNYCVVGHIQTTADLKANKDAKLVICSSGGEGSKVLKIYYENNVVLSLDCGSKILKIVMPDFLQITSTYSDYVSMVFENGNIAIMKIMNISSSNIVYLMTVIDKNSFQSNKLVDIVFSPYDRYKFAIMDSVGNWICGQLKQRGNVLSASYLENEGGSIFDAEELDNNWRRLVWGKNYDNLFLFDKSKIVSVNLKNSFDVTQISELKTWSFICDIKKIDQYVVCLTSKEILILEMNTGDTLSRVFSWKHHFQEQQRLKLSTIIIDKEDLVVGIHSEDFSVMFLYNFTILPNSEIKAHASPIYIRFPGFLEFHELYDDNFEIFGKSDNKINDNTEEVTDNDQSENNLRIVYKLKHQNFISQIKINLTDHVNYIVTGLKTNENQFLMIHQSHKRMRHVVEAISTLYENFDLNLDAELVDDEISQYENYGSKISGYLESVREHSFCKNLSDVVQLNSQINDIEELFSFISQLMEHLNSQYSFTEVNNVLASTVLKCSAQDFLSNLDDLISCLSDQTNVNSLLFLIKDIALNTQTVVNLSAIENKNQQDMETLNSDFQEIISGWSNGGNIGNMDMMEESIETGPRATNNVVSRLQSQQQQQQQLPEIRLSQSSQRKPKRKMSQLTQMSQVSQISQLSQLSQSSLPTTQFSQAALQSSLPSVMAPGFTLLGSQKNASQPLSQRTASQSVKKKKKKRAKGFF